MSLMPVEQPRLQEMQDVVERYIQNVNPTAIARELKIKRADVLQHIENWKTSAVGSDAMQDRIEELIATMDSHYSMLIQKAYEVITEVDNPPDGLKETMTRSQMLSQKMSAIKTIADLEAKRIDMLQKAGFLEAANVGDALAEMEEDKERLFNILEEVLCESCKMSVAGRYVTNNDSVVVVKNV